MKTNKKVQTNSVQKSEKENAVKVTALAIIPKPMTLLTPQDVPTATEVTEAPETATIPTVTEEASQQATFKTPLATATAETDLDITTIHPSTDNHRKTFNDASLQELAESIREVGILQAIAVRPRTEGGYEIIYGERRYRASLLAGAKTIKATIYNNVTDDEAEDMSLSENLQREQVRPTEEAKAFKRLLEKGRYDMYSLTARFGRSEKYIYTRLKLNELYAPVGELLDNETITVSVAEEISTYEPDIQKDVYEKHLKEGNGEDWTGYTLNLFKRYFEKYYTTDLGQYKFDKTECNTCVHNAANYNLFAEHNGCGHWKIQCKLPPKTKRFCPLKTFNNAPLKSLDRWGYYYFSLFPSVCSHFTDTFSCQLNPVRRMYNTIHNGICYCRVSDCIIPIVRWQLRGDDDGLAPMSVLYYIEQDGSFLGIKVHKEEVIQYEQRAPFDSLEFRFQCAFYFCHLKRTHKFRSIRIICPYALLAGFIPHCCGKEALPGTG